MKTMLVELTAFLEDILKMNFSVGVSMYREKVTSYW